jgi:RNA polymerase sigma factor (sigma-70 family)
MDTQLHALVIAAQNGDLDAFGTIVQRFQGMAYASAYAMVDDAHLAEDVAQEAFMEAYLNLPRLREIDAFPGWLRRIIFKQCDRLLRGKHLVTQSLETGMAYDIPIMELNPATVVEVRERERLVHRAIEALPEHERIVIVLFYSSGYALKEIATFLEVPITTVKKRLYDARKRLKSRLMEVVSDTLHEQRSLTTDSFSVKVRLLIAARLGDIARVKAMLAHDPTLVNARMKRGEHLLRPNATLIVGDTPLYEAATHNHLELVRLLLEYGAFIHAQTSIGETPLHGAVAAHHFSMVELLLDCGADINASFANGHTPLRLAVIKGHRDIVELLLNRGAAVNTRGESGLTPLHWAALKGYLEIVSLLLTKGADVCAQDDLRRTPLDWVVERAGQSGQSLEYAAVLTLLRQYSEEQKERILP